MLRFPILHSGFVAKNSAGLTKREYISNPFVENFLFKQTGDNTYANFFYSEQVETLYKQFQADRNVLRDFDFRERILVEAAKLFERNGIGSWIDLQNTYASVSYMHLEFILDTIRFIATGQRDMSTSMWQNLIVYKEGGNTHSFEKSEDLKQLLNSDKDAFGSSTSILLSKWVSHKGGYEDLLFTLELISGDKSAGINVALKPGG